MSEKYHLDKSICGDEKMISEFSVQIHQYNNDIKIVDIFGIFDCYTARTIRQELQKLIQEGNYNLLINLGHIEFMNVKAIRVLTSIADELRKYKKKVKICSLPEKVGRLFDLIGVKNLLSVYKNEQEALGYFIEEEK
jgi:anti-sigma B factor antagonist